jgi:hypothetical protein
VAPGSWRWCGAALTLQPAGGGEAVVIEPWLADLVRQRRGFRSTFAHAVSAYAELAGRRRAGIGPALAVLSSSLRAALLRAPAAADELSVRRLRQEFSRLAGAGAFVSLEAVLGPLAGPLTDDAGIGGAPLVLAVPTADRGRVLHRCLASYLLGPGRDAVECLVADDSTDESGTRQALEGVGARRPAAAPAIAHCGRAEKERMAGQLGRAAGADPSLLRFALWGEARLGFTAGANRNAILLCTAGRRVLSVDDDTLCEPRVPRGRRPAGWCALDSSFNARTVRRFVDGRAALDATCAAPRDVLGSHAELLGASLSRGLAPFARPGRILMDGADDNALADVLAGRGRVVLSMNGVVGHSGVAWPTRLLEMPPDGGRGAPPPGRLAAVLEAQAVAAQVPQLTLSNRSHCSTMFLGLDNTTLLPPFLPSLRSEDVLFGRLLRLCEPHAYTAHLPFALRHEPLEPRRLCLSQLAGHVGVEFSYLLGDLLEETDLAAFTRPAGRMRALGRRLLELGTVARGELQELWRLAVLRRTAAAIDDTERALASAGPRAPAAWSAAAQRRLAALRDAAVRDDVWVPFDLRGHGTEPGAAIETVQGLLHRFGSLLLAWPDIWEAARRAGSRF